MTNNNEIFHLTSIVLKGSANSSYKPFEAIFDTGADIHVTNDARLFVANKPAEYSGVVGMNGDTIQAKVGTLLNLGKCLYVSDCPATLVSAHVMEQMFNVKYRPMNDYTVYVSNHKPLHFSKMNEKSMYICDLKPYYNWYMSNRYVYHLDSDIDSRMRSLSRIQRDGVQKVLELQRSLAFPSINDIIYALRNGTMVNCPITIDDVKRFNMVYGKNPAEVKGKMTKPSK